ncbi:MAG: antibiotic biosynthesis monooxygenase [Pseudomonadales bacterium]
MATIHADQALTTLMVTFEVTPETVDHALGIIEPYVRDFIAVQPGFVSSNLHVSTDRSRIVHYAQWRSQADFDRFREKAQGRPEIAALKPYNASAKFFDIVLSLDVPAAS